MFEFVDGIGEGLFCGGLSYCYEVRVGRFLVYFVVDSL